jgi:hypothetical protein
MNSLSCGAEDVVPSSHAKVILTGSPFSSTQPPVTSRNKRTSVSWGASTRSVSSSRASSIALSTVPSDCVIVIGIYDAGGSIPVQSPIRATAVLTTVAQTRPSSGVDSLYATVTCAKRQRVMVVLGRGKYECDWARAWQCGILTE